MNGYTKLFGSILDSSIWQEADHVRLVWVTMLAMADRQGHVEAAIPGLAARARVSLENCIDALKRLSDPDQFSRTPDNDGRRIEVIDGGWRLINHAKYRAKLSDEALPNGIATTVGYVYYAGEENAFRVRIAWGMNPWARIKELQKTNPRMRLLALESGPAELENSRMSEFKHIEDKWFERTETLNQHIQSLRSSTVATEATNCYDVAKRSTTISPKAEAEAEAMGKKSAGKPRAAKPLPDSDWLKSLSENVAYKGIDIAVEFAKMQAWCSIRPGKIASRARFLKWLNNADRPIDSPAADGIAAKPTSRKVWQIQKDLESKENILKLLRRNAGQSMVDGRWEPALKGELKQRADAMKQQIETLRRELETAPV